MVRPRGKSNPMNPSRLLKNGANATVSVMNLQMPPLTPAALSKCVEEDLESQARASLSLFGFGARDAVNWSVVTSSSGSSSTDANSATFSSGAAMATAGNGTTGGGSGVMLMERVCPIGTNTFLWNTMNMGESGATGMNSSLINDPTAVDGSMNPGEDDPEWDPLGYGHIFASKILQQYLVKCVAVFPASVEEVIDLIIRSDRDDMETTMHHLVGIKTNASGVIYRRKQKRQRRVNYNRNNPRRTGAHAPHSTASAANRTARQRRALVPSHSHSSTIDCDASDSSSSDSEVDVVVDDHDNQCLSELSRQSSARHRSTRGQSVMESERSVSTSSYMSMSSSSSSLSSYMDEYRASLTCGHQGNLSLKWVVGEKTGRMFTQRANYCLLDYECVLVNDWEEGADGRPMYVRALQSCYLGQCQPWIDELGVKPTDLQPTGIMVRESKHRPGFVEVQFVASILEKAQLPMTSRRTKLRSLCAKIARLEEVITSRRLSQSLLAHQPHWVSNRERLGCHCCDATFGLTRRRHHCRLCGEICCSDCCPKKDVALPEVGTTSVRVCVHCVQKRRHSGDSIESSSSSSTIASAALSPTAGKGSSQSSYLATPPPPLHHPGLYHSLSSSSSPSDYYLSSSSGTSFGSIPSSSFERKPSLASSMFQKFKSTSLGAS